MGVILPELRVSPSTISGRCSMSKYDDLCAPFDSAKRNADDYITDCVLFCNKLATIGQGYFQCPSPICFAFL
jgi:hypothetical protein